MGALMIGSLKVVVDGITLINLPVMISIGISPISQMIFYGTDFGWLLEAYLKPSGKGKSPTLLLCVGRHLPYWETIVPPIELKILKVFSEKWNIHLLNFLYSLNYTLFTL